MWDRGERSRDRRRWDRGREREIEGGGIGGEREREIEGGGIGGRQRERERERKGSMSFHMAIHQVVT